jgi:hypothetical protein
MFHAPSRTPRLHDTISLAEMADALSQSADYRVLRRLMLTTNYSPSGGREKKTSILLDTDEQPGLSWRRGKPQCRMHAYPGCHSAELERYRN